MTPEMSRAVATVKAVLDLEDGGPQLSELIKTAEGAKTVKDLPNWAQAVLNYAVAEGRP